jgi:energy-coupling factor transport system permease protein
VLWRGGTFLGRRWDITLEAVTYGAVAALRVVVLVLVFALFSAVVDPDELLRLLRRVSYRSALTAALATRLVPVLAKDASRMSEAARCRPRPPGRAAVARSTLGRSLERAVDLAAALEVRGYAGARRPARVPRRWSRHDIGVAAAAVAIVVLAVAFKVAGAGWFDPYPTTSLAAGPAELALVAGLMLLAVAPLVAPGARLGVARA